MYKGIKFKDPRERRLAHEHTLMEEIVGRSSKISYEIIESTRSSKVPTKYRINYSLKSIVGINKDSTPIYGDNHVAEITLPPGYPGASDPPLCVMTTNVWHPNIRAHEPFKGRICVNSKAISAAHGIDDLILRIGEILQYKNYLAEDRPPYPEDVIVAKWVREHAEPMGLVNWQEGKSIDGSSLLDRIGQEDEPVVPVPTKSDAKEVAETPPVEEEDNLDIEFDLSADESESTPETDNTNKSPKNDEEDDIDIFL